MSRLKRRPFTGLFTYDRDADAAYIYLARIRKGAHGRTLHVYGNKSIYLDVDKDGRLLGIELLGHDLLPSPLARDCRPRRSLKQKGRASTNPGEAKE